MRQKSGPEKQPAEEIIRDIRRTTRRHFSAEEKIRIVLEGLRGEGERRRTLSPRGHRLVDVLWLVERVPGAGKRRLGRVATLRRGDSS
jgi:transposase